jgi:serine/threonine protein kinase
MSLPKKYKDLIQLGQGRFGTVYRALDPNNKIVAVKKFSKLSGKDIPYQILREINILKLLSHPNIIKIYDTYMGSTEINIVMEYGGENMSDIICELSMDERIGQLKHIFYQIVYSCLYMHKLEIIHRDLKPENILISWDDEKKIPVLKICDFGLAKKLLPFYRENNSYQICTLSYRPPELFAGETESYAESVDIWSIGCVIYEFVLGRKLFPGSKSHNVLQSILQQIPTSEEDLESLQLFNQRLDKCNTETYYKLPLLYNFDTRCEKTKSVLDPFQKIVKRMLVLNPADRISLDKIVSDPFFDSVRGYYRDLESELQNYRMRYNHNFKIRGSIKISPPLRSVHTDYILSIGKDYKLNEQTLFVAINLFDQYISGKRKNGVSLEKFIPNLNAVANCCTVLASKYIDIKPLQLEDFAVRSFSFKKLVIIEREILEQIEFEFNQPTLLNFYKEMMDENKIEKRDDILEKHLIIAKNLISDYDQLVAKGIPEIKEIFLNKINRV